MNSAGKKNPRNVMISTSIERGTFHNPAVTIPDWLIYYLQKIRLNSFSGILGCISRACAMYLS